MQRLKHLIDTYSDIPIEREDKEKHITMRRKEGATGVDLLILERYDFGVLPEQFMRRFEKIEVFVRGNKVINRLDIIRQE